MDKKVIIIGAGLGGMSAGIRLANAGWTVDIYESQTFPGGKIGQFEKDGFRFDTGPSLLTMPFVIEELFQDSGYMLQDFFEVKKLEILTKYFYPDGTIIDAYADQEKFAKEIEAKTSDSKSSVLNFLKYAKNIYDATADIFIFGSLEKFLKFPSLLNPQNILLLPRMFRLDPFRTMDQANSSFFKDPKTIQLFDRFATYNGSNPYRAPATLNVIAHVEHGIGGFYPAKGIYEIPNAIYKLALKKGVKFHFNSKVTQIIHSKNKILGINEDNHFIPCENIISNADVVTTYKKLLNYPSEYSKQELSTSVLVFNWGVKGIHENLEIHNILFSNDYKKEMDEIFSSQVPSDPTIYINVSSKYNLSDAPEGCENWFVLVNVPSHELTNTDIQNAKLKIQNKILEILGIDLKDKILVEEILTPQLIESRTSSFMGALYGPSSNSKFSAFLRQQAKAKDFGGLYFCGGSAHPGGGIPLVIESGKFAAERLIQQFDKSLNR